MKEIEQQASDKIEILKQQKQEKKTVFKNRIMPHEGHKCFEYNTVTNTLKYAEFTEQAIDFMAAKRGEIAAKRKVIVKENCVYFTVLNLKNAIKKIRKDFGITSLNIDLTDKKP